MKYDRLSVSDKVALEHYKSEGCDSFLVDPLKGIIGVKTYEDRVYFDLNDALEQIKEMEQGNCPSKDEFKTIFGYPIRELVLVATMLRNNGVTVEDVHKAAMSWSDGAIMAFTAAQQQIEEGFRKTIETMKEGK